MQQSYLAHLPYLIAALLPALTFHEWAHAIVARGFGDLTAQRQGRLTLNPLAHLDVLGTIAIIFIGFGWAKPVPVDPRNFRNSWAEFWVAAAGPMMNIVLACGFALMLQFGAQMWFGTDSADFVFNIIRASIQLNLALAFFNLIPIGPLDGNHLLTRLLPLDLSIRFSQWNASYGSMLLLGLIVFESFTRIGILSLLVSRPVLWVERFLLS